MERMIEQHLIIVVIAAAILVIGSPFLRPNVFRSLVQHSFRVASRPQHSTSTLTSSSAASDLSGTVHKSCPNRFDYSAGIHRLRHYHQHKAGGKTINMILERIVPINETSVMSQPLFVRRNGGEIHGNRKSIHKHIFKGGANDRFVTFVREPTAKVMSRFYYHRAMCNGTSWLRPSHKLAGVCCQTLKDYVEQRAMNNNQYQSLVAGAAMGELCAPSGNETLTFETNFDMIRRQAPTPGDICPRGGREGFVRRIQEILLDLSSVVYFGIVEKWQESIFLFCADAGIDPSSVVYCKKNSNPGAPKPHDLAEGMWGDGGKEALDALKKYNALDLATYEAALGIFQRKVACWEDSNFLNVATEAQRWTDEKLIPFQEETCKKQWNNLTYHAPVLGVSSDGKVIEISRLADPNYSISMMPDLRFMLSRTDTGNRTCSQLLADFPDCGPPMAKFLEPC